MGHCMLAFSSCCQHFSLMFLKENGVEFLVDQQRMRFRGTITVVSADNLSAQMMGGYKALHSAFRKCRCCMATDETMQTRVNLSLVISIVTVNITLYCFTCNFVQFREE